MARRSKPAAQNTAPVVTYKASGVQPASSSQPAVVGAMMAPTRPTLIAAPTPVARSGAG
ncbi:hypothetical protein [Streptomyces sp. BK79]|uniref:hypothetical protein n=1 Tax=Streptomyces sp. BK79 TaxID=3350097 RepID=UPI00376FC8DB